MASNIADDGSYGRFASLSGTFTPDEINKTMTFGGDGQADTGFILPSTPWLLVEVFDVETIAGDIGYTLFRSDVSDLANKLIAARTKATDEYTNYKIVATHYKGSNLADVYRGDQATALALAGIDTGIAFTPSASSWKISDTVVAPDGFVDLTDGLVAHYLLNNNPDDNTGTYDGSISGTVDFQGDKLDTLSGSVTIPSTGGSWCSYWKDTGSGMTLITSATIPTSLATDEFSNLRVYNATKTGSFLTELTNEGYYPKPLPLPTTTGLVAHYPLTGTAEDVVAAGTYDGTEGGNTYVDDTEFGSVADFDGGNDYINIDSLRGITGDFTLSLWFKPDTLGTQRMVFSHNTYSEADPIWLIVRLETTSKLLVHRSLSTTAMQVISTDALSVNTWYHIVFRGNLTTLDYSLHIDATLENQGTGVGSATNVEAADISKLGTSRGGGNQYYDGSLKNVRCYNRVIDTQEITDIYNYEKNFRPIDIDDGLVAYYPLANNSLDNYYNEYDGTADAGVTYDGTKATLPNGDNITFPTATGFVEAYYTIDGTVTKTATETALNSLTNCTLGDVRKYNKALSTEQQLVIGYVV